MVFEKFQKISEWDQSFETDCIFILSAFKIDLYRIRIVIELVSIISPLCTLTGRRDLW